MRAHFFQHVPFEGPGCIETRLSDSGYRCGATRFYDPHTLPRMEDVDFLVIMGGPMSVHDRSQYPWLDSEIEFINAFADTGRPMLGICLGAQLIAAALGGTVGKNPYKEIGWFPVRAEDVDHASYRFPERFMAFHWHGETFSPPPGAHRLASSDGCPDQAFRLGNIFGLQFHLETTPESANKIVSNCRNELIPDTYVMDEKTILSAPDSYYHDMNTIMYDLLGSMTR